MDGVLEQINFNKQLVNEAEVVKSNELKEKIKGATSGLKHKDLINNKWIKSILDYIDFLTLVSLLKLEIDIVAIKTAIGQTNALNSELLKIHNRLRYFERDTEQINAASQLWLNYFKGKRFSKTRDEQIAECKVLCEKVLKSGYVSEKEITEFILKEGNITNLIYITTNINSIPLSLGIMEIFNHITRLINKIFESDCETLLDHLYFKIQAEKQGTNMFRVYNNGDAIRFAAFCIGRMQEHNHNPKVRNNDLWPEDKFSVLEALCVDKRTKQLNSESLNFFVKTTYCHVNHLDISSLTINTIYKEEVLKNNRLEDQLKDKFFEFLEIKFNILYIKHIESMIELHSNLQEMQADHHIALCKRLSSFNAAAGFTGSQTFNMFRNTSSRRASSATVPPSSQATSTQGDIGEITPANRLLNSTVIPLRSNQSTFSHGTIELPYNPEGPSTSTYNPSQSSISSNVNQNFSNLSVDNQPMQGPSTSPSNPSNPSNVNKDSLNSSVGNKTIQGLKPMQGINSIQTRLKTIQEIKILKDEANLKPLEEVTELNGPEEILSGSECLLVAFDLLSKEFTSKSTTSLGCPKVSPKFFEALKPYMIATKVVEKKVQLVASTELLPNSTLKTTNLIQMDEFPNVPPVPESFIQMDEFPNVPPVPESFKIVNGCLEERLIMLPMPNTPTHKIKNQLCSLRLFDESKENFIDSFNKRLNTYIYNDYDIIHNESFIISSFYSDYFGIINRYQYYLLAFNNCYICYLGSTITVAMYIIEFLASIVMCMMVGKLLTQLSSKVCTYIPTHVQDLLTPYANCTKLILSYYCDLFLIIVLYKGFIFYDVWLVLRILALLYLKNYIYITNFFINYKKNYLYNINPQLNTSLLNIGVE